jgi:hypothetical protein
MAKDNPIFTYILIGGAAYLAWSWWTSQPAAAAPASGSAGPPATPAAPSVAYIPPTIAQQLQTAAGSATNLDADQWAFYWNQIGQPATDPTKWNTTFFPHGRPANGAAAPTMTAAAYVAALQGAGVSGYRRGMGAFMIPVPIVQGRGFGSQYTLGDLRKAGGR